MKLIFVRIGAKKHLLDACITDYQKRLRSFFPAEIVKLKNNSATLEKFFAEHSKTSFIYALDENGKQQTSIQFAEQLHKQLQDRRYKSIIFVVGESHGFDKNILSYCQEKLSLSKFTFTSDHAWLLLWEQVYRASQIIKGTGYHHE